MSETSVVTEGNKAPEFSIAASNGKTVSLKDFKGKKNVVLYFYPKDNTPGCTLEACAFRDHHADFEKADTVILGISKDSLKSHDSFIQKFGLPFILLSDTDAEVCNLYGVFKEKNMYGKKVMGIERTTLVIDKSGVVQKIYPKVKVDGHIEQVLGFIRENL